MNPKPRAEARPAAERRAAAFLDAVESELGALLGASRPPEPALLLEAARHLCLDGGKRARPRLVMAFGEAAGGSLGALVDVAVAAELMHTGSLLHDDVIDEATQRRGRPSVNVAWTNTVAVLSGDLLLALALARLAPHGAALLACAVDVVREMTESAMTEVARRGSVDVPDDVWRRIAEGKTGALFAFCGRAAGLVSGDPEAADCFARAGLHLGVAFQLADDLADLAAVDGGKDRFADVRTGNPSHTLFAAARRSAPLREALAEAWRECPLSADRAAALGEAALATGAVAVTAAAVDAELAAAEKALGRFAETEGGARVVGWARDLARAVAAQAEQAGAREEAARCVGI